MSIFLQERLQFRYGAAQMHLLLFPRVNWRLPKEGKHLWALSSCPINHTGRVYSQTNQPRCLYSIFFRASTFYLPTSSSSSSRRQRGHSSLLFLSFLVIFFFFLHRPHLPERSFKPFKNIWWENCHIRNRPASKESQPSFFLVSPLPLMDSCAHHAMSASQRICSRSRGFAFLKTKQKTFGRQVHLPNQSS